MNDDRARALVNLVVFTPLAWYGWTGERPPSWLIAAAVVGLGYSAARDLRTLIAGPPEQDAGVAGSPPSFREAQRYRVVRSGVGPGP